MRVGREIERVGREIERVAFHEIERVYLLREREREKREREREKRERERERERGRGKKKREEVEWTGVSDIGRHMGWLRLVGSLKL